MVNNMNFIVQNENTGKRYSVDISEYTSFDDMIEGFKEDPRFGDSEVRFIDAEEPEGAVFLQGDFLDSKIFEYFNLSEDEKEAVYAWYKDFGGSDSVRWVLDAFVAKSNDEDDYEEFLTNVFKIPEDIIRFINMDSVKREGGMIFQVARGEKGEYFIFQRH